MARGPLTSTSRPTLPPLSQAGPAAQPHPLGPPILCLLPSLLCLLPSLSLSYLAPRVSTCGGGAIAATRTRAPALWWLSPTAPPPVHGAEAELGGGSRRCELSGRWRLRDPGGQAGGSPSPAPLRRPWISTAGALEPPSDLHSWSPGTRLREAPWRLGGRQGVVFGYFGRPNRPTRKFRFIRVRFL